MLNLPFTFVDYSQNLFDVLSQHLFKQTPDTDNLSQITVWCDSHATSQALRNALSDHAQQLGKHGFLPPDISTLKDWVIQRWPPSKNLLNDIEKQLILVEAVKLFPTLFRTNNPWAIAKELISLFDECALSQISLNQNKEIFNDMLVRAYTNNNVTHENISRESEIIQRLWKAYSEEITARGFIDPIQHYCNCLLSSEYQTESDAYYLLGKHYLAPVESIFLSHIAKQKKLEIYYPNLEQHALITNTHPHINYEHETGSDNNPLPNHIQALNIIYSNKQSLHNRIQTFKDKFINNPLSSYITIHEDTNSECHVQAICLQAKRWLLQGKTPLAIISSDRSLSRRIRAVLEEHEIHPRDPGGWTLSTTSAATVIEILLDAIEYNFQKDYIIDLLNSPFIRNINPGTSVIQQIINSMRHQMPNGKDNIDSYIEQANKLIAKEGTDYSTLVTYLQKLKIASKPLAACIRTTNKLYAITQRLLTFLTEIELENALLSDQVGTELLTILENAHLATRQNRMKLSWSDWRKWLREQFENNCFTPKRYDVRVTLCGLEHLDHYQFNAIILAGGEKKRLHNYKKTTFFNENVRHELRMQTRQQKNAIDFVRFRKVLTHKHVTLTSQKEIDGELQELSHWIELLQVFSQQAFNESLSDDSLKELIKQSADQNKIADNMKISSASTPAPSELIPHEVSASRYQTLIDCPYQFFCKYVLALKTVELEDDFSASDFGILVHKCLHRFHFNADGTSKQHKYSSEQRDFLCQTLDALSQNIFSSSGFSKSIAEGWLQRWQNNIPSYIDWLLETNDLWENTQGEQLIEKKLDEHITLFGQIDRLDLNKQTQQYALIDFKTGSNIPSKKSIESGEAVQLPFYSLLHERITEVKYLDLSENERVSEKANIQANELHSLQALHKERLTMLFKQLCTQTALPANGVESTCRYCDYQGICRKSHWSGTTEREHYNH